MNFLIVDDVRKTLLKSFQNSRFVIDKTGVKLVEIVGAGFLADEPLIFGEVNHDYVRRESEWYHSMSRNVNDIPGGPPAIWKAVSAKEMNPGLINSNYGWMLFSPNNWHQYEHVVKELKANPFSRRALAIYNRPTMHYDYNWGGMSDFVCTNAVQYLIRDGFLHVVVQMRSNDAWAGYRNDRAWQAEIQGKMAQELDVIPGNIEWQVGSLHLYEKDFYLIDHYAMTGEVSIKKSAYRELYPDSKWT